MAGDKRGIWRASALFAVLLACLVFPGISVTGALAQQPLSPEEELARRFAPIVILQRQDEACDASGEPYLPAPVNVVFDDRSVTLRQGADQEPVGSPIESADLFRLPDHFATDLPGSPRTPGCDYETHFKRIMGDQRPVIYAHIATEEGQPGIALQYWFFYYFNDFNNLHEGDWEMIQLLFDAESIAEALMEEPAQVAFAQHSGGETAAWDAPKLEREGTRPVVYASRGSHASYFGPGLWLGWGQDGSGLGCDITNGGPLRIDPEVRLIPSTIGGADDPFSWVTYAGRWGEREAWVYDGPTGPAFKAQWTAPVSWMTPLRADSIRVSGATVIGPAPSDVFCTIVENSSTLLTLSQPYPLLVAGILVVGLALLAALVRVSWPLLRETWQVYRRHFLVFAGIGSITIPATLLLSLLQYLLARSPEFASLTTLTEDSAEVEFLLSAVSLVQAGLLFLVVTPAVIQAVGDIAADEQPSVRRSLREGLRKLPDYLWTVLRALMMVVLLAITVIGIPWAVNRFVRWQLGEYAAILEGIRGKAALERSATAIRGQWWQAAANWGVLAFLGGTPGIIVALTLMILVRIPIDAANGVASLVYAVSQPFATAGLAVLYLRWRGEGGEGGEGGRGNDERDASSEHSPLAPFTP